MKRKVKDDDENHNIIVPTLTKLQPNLSSKKDRNAATTMRKQQQLQMSRISLSCIDTLTQTLPNIHDPPSKSHNSDSVVVSTTQGAINMATELSFLLLEPRSIEQMSAHPMGVDDSFTGIFLTQV
jgi:hypothetical protein